MATEMFVKQVYRDWLLVMYVVCLLGTSSFGKDEFQYDGAVCSCPGDVLVYNCTVVGGGSTIWGGSAFDCATDDILLRHVNFIQGTSKICNDGNIIGESVRVDGNCYTSRLSVTVSTELHNKTIRCYSNSNTSVIQIGESLISVPPVIYQEAPNGVQLTTINATRLTFNWNVDVSNCSELIQYSISSNCGTCSIAANNTAVCTGLRLPQECTFSVQRVICGQAGLGSNPIRVMLRVPSEPQVDVIAVYDDKQVLIGFMTCFNPEASFNIATGIPGITHYTISYSNKMEITQDSSNMEKCTQMIDIPSLVCTSSTNVDVTVSASNILGQGSPSAPITIGCMNKLVHVEYNSIMSTIDCKFLNMSDTSIKFCSVVYGQCGQRLVLSSQGNSSEEAPNYVALNIDPENFHCYEVTATGDAMTVIVKGRIESTGINTNVILITVVSIGGLTILVTIGIIMFFVLRRVRQVKRRLRIPPEVVNNQSKALTREHKCLENINLKENSDINDQSRLIPTRDSGTTTTTNIPCYNPTITQPKLKDKNIEDVGVGDHDFKVVDQQETDENEEGSDVDKIPSTQADQPKPKLKKKKDTDVIDPTDNHRKLPAENKNNGYISDNQTLPLEPNAKKEDNEKDIIVAKLVDQPKPETKNESGSKSPHNQAKGLKLKANKMKKRDPADIHADEPVVSDNDSDGDVEGPGDQHTLTIPQEHDGDVNKH